MYDARKKYRKKKWKFFSLPLTLETPIAYSLQLISINFYRVDSFSVIYIPYCCTKNLRILSEKYTDYLWRLETL